MRRVTFAIAFFSFAAPMHGATAQSAASDSTTGLGRPRIGIALGLETAQATDVRPFASASLQWRLPRSGFGVRLELAGSHERERRFGPIPLDCTDCENTLQRSDVGLFASGLYEFRHRKALRPYLLSGFGVAMTRERLTMNSFSCDASSGLPICQRTDGFDAKVGDWSPVLGLQAGAGLAWRVGELDLFAEQRYRTLGESGLRRRTMPLTVGIRW